jgi:YVTN family beta-propeller protein
VYRRRRIAALVVLIAVLVLVVALAAWACGGDEGTSGAADTNGGTAAPATGDKGTAAPSPVATAWSGPPSNTLDLKLRETISSSAISPKSVVSTGNGYVFAQNMMYRHTMTVYDAESLKLVKTIKDSIDAGKYGLKGHSGTVQGAPVEAAMLPDGRFIYVSQYSMYGGGFSHPGDDVGSPASGYDKSYVYRVSLGDLKIDKAIKVGAVPKFVAVTPDQKYLLVSNWCSYTLSVIDVHTSKQVKDVYLGPYPRGIAVDPGSRYAYVAVMGSTNIARVDLQDFHIDWISGVGSGPRHLCMAPDGEYLYATLNGEGTVAKIDPSTRKVLDKVATGSQPRSMAIAPDGKSLYVVNYDSSTMSKVRTSDMKVIQTVDTNALPIGITYDVPTKSVWVCCYTGSIMVFRER